MRFLVDAQLPPLLARYLSQSGHDAEHVAEIGLTEARDRDIWNRVLETDAILVTKDQDFITMRALHARGPAIVWVRIGNTTRAELIARFSVVLPEIVTALQSVESVIEVSGA